MEISPVLIEEFSAVFFFILFVISAYFYGKNRENKIPVYLSIAMMFLFVRELSYFLVDAEAVSAGFKVFGGIIGALAGILFLYVFIAEERVLGDIRRIRNAFK